MTTPTTAEAINNTFVFTAAVLVFFMHVGFSMIEGAAVQVPRQSISATMTTLCVVIAGEEQDGHPAQECWSLGVQRNGLVGCRIPRLRHRRG